MRRSVQVGCVVGEEKVNSVTGSVETEGYICRYSTVDMQRDVTYSRYGRSARRSDALSWHHRAL